MKTTIDTALGDVVLEWEDQEWMVTLACAAPNDGLTFIHVTMESDEVRPLPQTRISWSVPGRGIHYRWHPFAGSQGVWLPPDWSSNLDSQLAQGAPVVCLYGAKGENRLTYALSDALNPVSDSCGICEFDGRISSRIQLFETPAAPMNHYELTIRFDSRAIAMEKALSAVSDWWAGMPEYLPQAVPEEALHPLYSTWYSYHQDVVDVKVERECQLAVSYGMRAVIVDDGWQTEDHSGGYGYCGDWDMCEKRFPNMRNHVAKVHAMGLKYILWYSVPWVGIHSQAFKTFQGKFLYVNDNLQAAALDPRFPDVRDYLISTYEQAVRDWDLDGFKLDFIDSFKFTDQGDPAMAEDYAGRDYKLLSAAVDRLLTDVKDCLQALKPDILIEFRQHYIGPAMRKYGNMFRVADCPGDLVANRMGIANLRLLAGGTAVHGDMLLWNYDDTAEAAALQLLAVFFGVPQISVRLADIPESHRIMLAFYLGIWEEYRQVLLTGKLEIAELSCNAPVMSAEKDGIRVAIVYEPGRCLDSDMSEGQSECLINATAADYLLLDMKGHPTEAVTCDVQGRVVSRVLPQVGLQKIPVPPSGLIRIRY